MPSKSIPSRFFFVPFCIINPSFRWSLGIFFIASFSLHAQKSVSYKVTEETYYEIGKNSDLKSISSQDMIEMKPLKEVYKITEKSDGKSFQSVKEYLIKNENEAWVPDMKKIVTDHLGTKIYNSKGELIFEREHPEALKREMKDIIKNGKNSTQHLEFPDISSLKNGSLSLPEATINQQSDGKIHIKKPKKTEVDGQYLDMGEKEEIEVDEKKLSIKTKVNNSKNREIESEEIYFKHLPKDKKKALKTFEKIKKADLRYNDISQVKYIAYEDYTIDDKKVFEGESVRKLIEGLEIDKHATEEETLTIYPNPGTDEVSILYSQSLKLRGIHITNVAGVPVSPVIMEQATGRIKLNISSLKPDVYVVIITHAEGMINQKFIKF